jgi:hypothetical protein
MSEQSTPTTPAADAAPTDDALVADLESILAQDAGEAAPPPASTPSAGQAPPPADTLEIPADLEAQLVERAKGRQAERALREPVEQMRAKLETLEQQLARAPGFTAIAQAVAAKDAPGLAAAFRAAGLDPAAVQQLATQAQLKPSPQDAIQQAIGQGVEQALARLGIKPPPQQQQAEPQALAPDAVFDAYAGYVEGAAERFPIQAQMGAYAGPACARYLRETFIKPGHYTPQEIDTWPPDQVAAMFERHLASRGKGSLPPPGATIASGEQASQPSGAPTASGGPSSTSTGVPRSLTNGHAADAPRTRPQTAKEIDQDLERELEDMLRSARA